MIRQEVKELIKKSVKELQKEKKLVFKIPEPIIESPRVDEHGDYSSNIALVLSSSFKEKPIKIAKLIKEKIEKIESSRTILGKIEIREPGFVNFFISSDKIKLSLKNALKEGDGFGKLEKKRRKVQVEFISANPTGPLTLGNGRGGFCGDVISNVLEKAGLEVEREYYVNDAGEQIKKLGDSVLGKEDAAYKGEYINEVRKKINSGNPEEADLIKIHVRSGKLTFLHYDDFEGKREPLLLTRIKINLRNQFVQVFDHSAELQPLFNKKLFL